METALRQGGGWLVFLGIVQIVVGILAILAPLGMGIAVTLLVGIVLCIAGGAQTVNAFGARSFGSGVGAFLGGVLYLVAGILMIAHPGAGLAILTFMLAAMLFMRGGMQIGAALDLRPTRGWGWLMFGGVLGVVLGILILSEWPLSGLWAVGVFVGVEVLYSGFAHVTIGRGLREVAGDAPAA